MTDACPSAVRKRAEKAARALRVLDTCLGVDVLDPQEGTRANWTLEATFRGSSVPPAAVSVLADADCAIGPSTLRTPNAMQLLAIL